MKETFSNELTSLLNKYSNDPKSPAFNLCFPSEELSDYLVQKTISFILKRANSILRDQFGNDMTQCFFIY